MKHTDNESIKLIARIKSLMKARKVLGKELAIAVDVTEGAMSHYLTGKRPIPWGVLTVIADKLNVGMSELVGEDVYIVQEQEERSLIDSFRDIPKEDKAKALAILATLKKPQK